jgi:predicted Zn-ribbon and HTH transcriptional regulator
MKCPFCKSTNLYNPRHTRIINPETIRKRRMHKNTSIHSDVACNECGYSFETVTQYSLLGRYR